MKKKQLYLIGISVLLILIYLSIFYLNTKADKGGCKKNIQFNSEEWKINRESRYCMLSDIIDNKILLKKSKQEVIDILGEPFMEGVFYEGKSMSYRTSAKANYYLTWYLFLKLERDTVVYFQKSAD